VKLGGEIMSEQIYSDIQRKKNSIIDSLIHLGIYKKGNKQLYELTLHELETEYQIVNPAIQDLSF
jgi:Fur-regulated basic protein A